MINSERVTEMFMNSLFTSEEVVNGVPIVEPIIVYGITNNIGFHPERLKVHLTKVSEMLAELPIQFQFTSKGGGDGWSFLNMCMTKDDKQWTGFHQIMEQLCLLAIGLKLAEFPASRELWSLLPGNVPYFKVL
jgi:hypothetical protein